MYIFMFAVLITDEFILPNWIIPILDNKSCITCWINVYINKIDRLHFIILTYFPCISMLEITICFCYFQETLFFVMDPFYSEKLDLHEV